MDHFCTYFDRNYLAQGLTLYRSLVDHAGPFTLWVLCFDDTSHDVLSRLKLTNLRPVSLQEFEEGDETLQNAKGNRSRVEYFFTCTPSWLLYLLNRHPEIERLTYLDADLMFYAAPSPVFKELGERSILIVGHRFPERLRHLESSFGIYNVGLLAFRNDSYGKGCLQWWRDHCLEWCFDRPEKGRFADQKYLDDWPVRFGGVVVLQNKGAGLAPWNHMNYRVQIQEREITVDGDPLIFYHFQGVRIINRRFFDPGTYRYGTMSLTLRRRLYSRYVHSLFETEKWMRSRLDDLERISFRLYTRDYRLRTFLLRLLQGQIMLVPGE
jgi:hypothetical protein